MVTRYEKQHWDTVPDPPLGAVFEDLEIVECKFSACTLGQDARRPADRTIVRRVRASKCVVDGGSGVGPVLFEDVHLSNIRTIGSMAGWVFAPLFKHVTLSGKFNTLALCANRWPRAIDPDPAELAAFYASAEEFYASVDWALDISEARFRCLDWRLNCPARLVRRDPVTQVVVTRERAAEETWRKIALHPMVSIGLNMFVKSGLPDMILTAGKASPSFKQEMESIQALRDAGVVEPELH